MVRHIHGGTKEGDDGVANVLVDGALVLQDYVAHGGEVLVQNRNQLGCGKLFRQGGEALDIGEEGGDIFLGTTQRQGLRVVHQVIDNILGKIGGEGLTQEPLVMLGIKEAENHVRHIGEERDDEGGGDGGVDSSEPHQQEGSYRNGQHSQQPTHQLGTLLLARKDKGQQQGNQHDGEVYPLPVQRGDELL